MPEILSWLGLYLAIVKRHERTFKTKRTLRTFHEIVAQKIQAPSWCEQMEILALRVILELNG